MFEKEKYICRHLKLTKEDILEVIRRKNLSSFAEIQDETDAGTVCGSCIADIEELLAGELEKRRSAR